MTRRHSGARSLIAALTLYVWSTAISAQQVHGVTDTEILIGTVTDLSGVTAIQGVNNANAIRILFDEDNVTGVINGREIRYVVEESQYQVPRGLGDEQSAEQRQVFMASQDGGTPMYNAIWPMALEKGTPRLLPLTAARSMYDPFNHLTFSQTSSYVHQVRAGIKYFVEQRVQKTIRAMYSGHRLRQGRVGRGDLTGGGRASDRRRDDRA